MFYGWWIVIGVFFAQLFVTGFFVYGFPLLVVPVQAAFGATREQVMWGMSGAGLVGLVIPPVAGYLVDKWSARGLMIIGVVTLALAFEAMALSQSVIQFGLSLALVLSIPNALLGPVTGSTLVSRWFIASRGRALGYAAVGTSVGGIVVPIWLQYWISAADWRVGLHSLAILTLSLVLPFAVFAIRDHPSDKGLAPEGSGDGGDASDAGDSSASGETWSTLEILRNVPFWLISVCLGLLFMVYTAVMSNLHAYASDLGVSGADATTLISVIAVCGFVGKIAFGYAADRISLRVGLWGAQALAGSGILILSLEPSYPLMLFAAVLMGLAAGGMLPVWGAIIAAIFGTRSYGQVMGMTMPDIGILVMPGFVIAGRLRDTMGDYVLALQLFAGLLVVSAAVLLPLKLETASKAT
jgi:MFS family permease